MISQQHDLRLQSAIQLSNLGLVQDSLGETAAALERHRAALVLVDDPAWAAQIRINLSGTLVSTGAFDEAQALLDAALEYARAGQGGDLLIAALNGQARLLLARQQPAAADDALAEAAALARKLDHRRLLAEALALRSQQQAALGHAAEAAAAWDEAHRLYLMLHMPQGKTQPLWLTASAARP